MAAAYARYDGEALLQVSNFDVDRPALAQTAAMTAHASSYHQALTMEAAFGKLAAEAVRTGETPSMDSAVRKAVSFSSAGGDGSTFTKTSIQFVSDSDSPML